MQIRNDVLLFSAVTNNEIEILSGIQILSTLSFEFAKSPLSSFPDHKTHSFFAFEEETSLAINDTIIIMDTRHLEIINYDHPKIIIWSSHDHHKLISSRILVIWHLTLNINLVSNWKVEQKMEAADKLLSAQVNNRRGSRKIRIWNHYKYGRFCKDLLLSST